MALSGRETGGGEQGRVEAREIESRDGHKKRRSSELHRDEIDEKFGSVVVADTADEEGPAGVGENRRKDELDGQTSFERREWKLTPCPPSNRSN